MERTYELRSHKAGLLRGHPSTPLEPPDIEKILPTHVGHYFNGDPVMEPRPQVVPGDVSVFPASGVLAEAARLFSHPDCAQLTITEVALDANGAVILRGTPHFCEREGEDGLQQVEDYLEYAGNVPPEVRAKRLAASLVANEPVAAEE